jgi:hypothetical protein
MKSDEKRSHRLNYLLKYYLSNPTETDLYLRAKQMGVADSTLSNPTETDLYLRAKQMGVADSTAKDYIRTVIIQAKRIHSH